MAKSTARFVCQNCGAIAPRWQGRCDTCGEWNTIVEENTTGGIGAGPASLRSPPRAIPRPPTTGSNARRS